MKLHPWQIENKSAAISVGEYYVKPEDSILYVDTTNNVVVIYLMPANQYGIKNELNIYHQTGYYNIIIYAADTETIEGQPIYQFNHQGKHCILHALKNKVYTVFQNKGSQPGGQNEEIQFNDEGAFGGIPYATYNKESGVVTIPNLQTWNFHVETEWNYVGQPGQPPFSSYFFSNYSFPQQALRFRKVGNVLQLKGYITASDDVVQNGLVFTLPEGIRPIDQSMVPINRIQNFTGKYAILTINQNGTVNLFDEIKAWGAHYSINNQIILD